MKLKYDGRDIEGTEIPFSIVNDGAVMVEAEDGAHLRVRPIIVRVLRTDEKNDEGKRVYVVQHFVRVTLDRDATQERPHD